MKQSAKHTARAILSAHYKDTIKARGHALTDEEITAELANLKRRYARGTLDTAEEILHARLLNHGLITIV